LTPLRHQPLQCRNVGALSQAHYLCGVFTVAGLMRHLLPMNYRAILAKDVAHALVLAALVAKPGILTLMSGEMQGIE
jgi:ABC-type thiamin/hydroxymethylpyrimidine transport system permease subunit